MASSIRTAAALYAMDSTFFKKKIGGLDQDVVDRRVSDNANPILWMAGHLTATRVHLLDLLGEKTEVPWVKMFSDSYDPTNEYPDMDTINDVWGDVSERLLNRMETVSEDELSKPIEYELPHGNNTVRGSLIFFAYHEAWHLGQIAFALKCYDMEGLVPY
jgi:hypothetical protein